MIILKGAGRPGQLRPDFFSKMDFHRPHVSQFFSNDKDKILQDVSSLPFYPKTRSVDSLFRIPTFFFDRFSTFCRKTKKTCFSKQKQKTGENSLISQVRCADMPAARQTLHFLSMFDQQIKIDKNRPNKKNAKL